MRVLPFLRDALGDHAPIDRYELVAELADGIFGIGVPNQEIFFHGVGWKFALTENKAPGGEPYKAWDAMERLVGRVMEKCGISPAEVEMRLALRGVPWRGTRIYRSPENRDGTNTNPSG